jgi:hypothetical protein
MKRPFILLALAVVLLPLSGFAGERSELQVKRDNTTVLTLRFSGKSLDFFDQIPSQLTSVLREHGIDCCSAQTRISESAWRCCHGKFVISSSNPRLQNVLAAAFGGTQYSSTQAPKGACL